MGKISHGILRIGCNRFLKCNLPKKIFVGKDLLGLMSDWKVLIKLSLILSHVLPLSFSIHLMLYLLFISLIPHYVLVKSTGRDFYRMIKM